MDTLEKKEPDSLARTQITSFKKTFKPDVDIINGKKAITFIADMPGVNEKSVDISLEKNVLTISGSIVFKDFEGYNRSYTEYETGGYCRAFSIADDIDKEGITAVVKNGVLKVILPKTELVKQHIEIKAA